MWKRVCLMIHDYVLLTSKVEERLRVGRTTRRGRKPGFSETSRLQLPVGELCYYIKLHHISKSISCLLLLIGFAKKLEEKVMLWTSSTIYQPVQV
jgi:hypothetical protein